MYMVANFGYQVYIVVKKQITHTK